MTTFTRPALGDPRPATWIELLRRRAEMHPERIALSFLEYGEDTTAREIRYAELEQAARTVAADLQSRGLGPGDRGILLYPPGVEFAIGFLGCLFAGVAAVPVYPPLPAQLDESLSRIRAVVRDCSPAAVLASRASLELRGGVERRLPELRGAAWVATDAIAPDAAEGWTPPEVGPGGLAFLQYTSGSTSEPKGVMVSHASLLHNSQVIYERFGHDDHTRGVIWLPPYHDMGLIGGILQPLYAGVDSALLSPFDFLEQPARWLRAVSDIGASTSGGPNFAYELCLRRIAPEECEGLDLSSWRVAFCGAEPVRGETFRRFAAAFAPYGFRPEAFYPCYGLAEATLMVSGGTALKGLASVRVRRSALECGRVDLARDGEPEDSLELLGNGRPGPGLEVRIVDPETRSECPPDRVGEIWITGPSVATGYWRNEEASRRTFGARLGQRPGAAFLRSGDTGFYHEGELYVCGRIKDLLIVRGRNVAPQDVEATIDASHPGLRPGCCAVFALPDERVVAVQELRRNAADDATEVLEAIRRAVTRRHDLSLHCAVLVEPRTIAKTTSGKIRRAECRSRFLAGELSEIARWEARGRPAEDPGAARAGRVLELLQGLRKVLAEVLQIDPQAIEPKASLAEMGLDSLSSIEFSECVAEQLGIRLPLVWITEGTSLGEAAGRLAGAQRGDRRPEIRPDPGSRHLPFPLTDLQRAYYIGRLGFYDIGKVSSHAYFEFDSDDIDLGRLEGAWGRVVRRHDALRTVVCSDREQVVLEQVRPYAIEVADLRAMGSDEVEARLLETRSRMSQEVRPLDQWPLFEIRAHRLPDGKARLHIGLDYFVADASSLFVMLRDWATAYRDPEALGPPPEVRFRDWVLAAGRDGGAEALERSLAYWRERAGDLPPGPQLPLAHRPAELSAFRVRRRTGTLDAEQWSAISDRARRAGTTPSAVLLGAYAEVLGAWCNEPRFSLNVTYFERPSSHADLAGQFASFVPVSFDRSEAKGFEQKTTRAQRELWQALDHRQLGGARILRELSRARGGAPVTLPVVFTCVLEDLGALEWLGAPAFAVTQTPQVWIDHQVFERRGDLVFHWDVVEDLFPSGMLDDLFAAYELFLQRLADDEAAWSEARHPTVSHAELARRTPLFQPDPAPEARLDALFAERAVERAGELAVVDSRRRLTYAELSGRAARLAARLREEGAAPGRLVAVLMEKGWEQAVAALAAIGSGAAYLPIDANLPQRRVEEILEDAEAQLVLTQREVSARVRLPAGVECIVVEEDDATAAGGAAFEASGGADDLAVVIYTSGSTGRPKGVMLAHRGLANAVLQTNRRFSVGHGDRVLALTPLHHDMSIYDLFGVLAAGGTVVFPDAQLRREPRHWLELMQREGVTIWNSVPAMMKMLLSCADAEQARLPDSLRLAFLGGDWIPTDLPGRLAAVARRARAVSVGGPTETSLWNIWHPVSATDAERPSVPYGMPIPHARYYVLDERLCDCPSWVVGELCCAGVGLTRGYWRDAAGTRARFSVHPRTGERLYRTGDLGRYLPDGSIEFVGRNDTQVEINGQRLELREVEAALGSHADVEAVAVVAVGERGENLHLAAFVVTAAGRARQAGSLRQFLQERLPVWAVPARIAFVDTLPLNANGKIDRQVLAATPRDAFERDESGAERASDELLQQIGRCMEDALMLPDIDPEADLTDLGADSLDLLRAANRLENEFGFRPSIDEFFELSTLEALAGYYEARLSSSGVPDRPPESASESVESLVGSFKGLLDPAERERFREGQPGIRVDDAGRPAVPLQTSAPGAASALRRHSCRSFAARSVPLEVLADLLGRLRPRQVEGGVKYAYGSPGGLYPVQAYLLAREGGIETLEAGSYYYHPRDHGLVQLGSGARLDRRAHWPSNRRIYDGAAFSIFLIADLRAIAPMYGAASRDFCLLEAGAMAHELALGAAELGLGVCQIGYVDRKPLSDLFELEKSHVLATSLVGGWPGEDAAVTRDPTVRAAAPDGPVRSPEVVARATRELAPRAALDPGIDPGRTARTAPREAGRVLLTGATGFLGCFLLAELLGETDARVTCLVRAASPAAGATRLREALEGFGRWRPGWEGRIDALPGDLSRPLLGLDPRVYEDLAEEIDAIYHNGARVSWIESLEDLSGPNVGGTEALLRLACLRVLKPVHYTSSLAVFPFSGRTFSEEAPLDHGQRLYGGYPQSKWVAEALVREAIERGCPARVYRPALVTGDSRTGAFNPHSYLDRMIKGCIQLGAAPSLAAMVDMVPVDFVARALVHVSRRVGGSADTYHFANPQPIALPELVEWMCAYGYGLRVLPFDVWKNELLGAADFSANALRAFGPFLENQVEADSLMARTSSRNTNEALEGSAILCPPADGRLLSTYFDYYIRSGFLDAPVRRGASVAPGGGVS